MREFLLTVFVLLVHWCTRLGPTTLRPPYVVCKVGAAAAISGVSSTSSVPSPINQPTAEPASSNQQGTAGVSNSAATGPEKPDETESAVGARWVALAVLGWVGQTLFAYGVRRYNMIKTVEVDLVYRITDAVTDYNRLMLWHTEFAAMSQAAMQTKRVPMLTLRSEEHVVYQFVQSEMVECLWGKEVQRVRAVYRYLSLIQRRKDIVRKWYEDVVEQQSMNAPSKLHNTIWFSHVNEELRHSVDAYRSYLERMVENELLRKRFSQMIRSRHPATWHCGWNNRQMRLLRKITQDMFLSRRCAYTVQTFWPMAIIISLAIPLWCMKWIATPYRICCYLAMVILNIVIWLIVFWWTCLQPPPATLGPRKR
jgi:hypothetical protein